MELATERSHKMPDRYKMLAEMKAAVLAGCEWCIDIGAFLLDRGGVPSEQVRNILRHRDSDAFDELEKLVLDYAEGMTRTPVDVSDELFAALRLAIAVGLGLGRAQRLALGGVLGQPAGDLVGVFAVLHARRW